MRQRGTIKGWKDDKGFGFVTPLAGGEDAFVHINAFLNRQRRPVDGDEISYDAVQDFQQRWQAKVIRYADEPVPAAPVSEPARLMPAAQASHFSALPLLRVLLVLLVLAIIGLAAHQIWARSTRVAQSQPAIVQESAPIPVAPIGSPGAQALLGSAAAPATPAPPQLAARPGASLLQSEPEANAEGSSFRCDGRTRCPQMHSCEEANWFVAHCPNTEMDGDGDGVACERQWCSNG